MERKDNYRNAKHRIDGDNANNSGIVFSNYSHGSPSANPKSSDLKFFSICLAKPSLPDDKREQQDESYKE